MNKIELERLSKELIDLKLDNFEQRGKELVNLIYNYQKENNDNLIIIKKIIEPLKDSFLLDKNKLCVKIISFLIQSESENHPNLINFLRKKGFGDSKPLAEDLENRYNNIICKSKKLNNIEKEKIKKVFLLSRATLGAEFLISSMIVRKVLREVPNSKIIFIDSMDYANKFFIHPRIENISSFVKAGKKKDLKFNRNNISWIDRLMYPLLIHEFINKNIKGLSDDEWIVIDPDSRLSQTGILPICAEKNYFFISLSLDKLEQKSFSEGNYQKIKQIGELINIKLKRVNKK